jgi:large subunit ribosomal protein L7Ae
MSGRSRKIKTKKDTKKGGSAASSKNPLFQKNPKSFRIGGDIRAKRDLGRFVRWPKYIRIQRQRKILQERLKVPPAINQFKEGVLAKNEAVSLFKLLNTYRRETKAEKKERLHAAAEEKVAGGAGPVGAKDSFLQFGLNHVTYLVEKKRAKLVCIASDVDPIELVVWLPALCRQMDVPYCIVHNKARLGTLVGQKSATAVCLTNVNQEDNKALSTLVESFAAKFTDNAAALRTWGGGRMGAKTNARIEKREAARRAEAAKKAMF